MNSDHQAMKLPEPLVPALQALSLLKGQTALVTGANSRIGRAAICLVSDFIDELVGTAFYLEGGRTLYPGFESGGWSRPEASWSTGSAARPTGAADRLRRRLRTRCSVLDPMPTNCDRPA